MLEINTLGTLSVTRDGREVPLPQSKKTRALLVYLLLTARPHRRDRLCEMFWDIPDDPRGALRWSLSKLRNIVNDNEQTRVLADRERIELATSDIQIDIRSIEALCQNDLSRQQLTDILQALNDPLLEGLDLPNHETYQNWLTSERISVEKLHTEVIQRLEGKNKAAREEALRQQSGKDKEAHEKHAANQLLKRQKIQFCETSDKVRIAYATVGEGAPLVKAANWLSHLELDWDAPIWSPLFKQLAQDHLFIRYDERGNGLSDWEVKDISFEAFVKDLETLVDALELDTFPLLGISQGAAVSIEYAVRHPQRVSHLILFGGYAAGWRINSTAEQIKEREAVMTLTKSGWGQDNPAYRQIFSSTFMPSGSIDELNWFNEFQRQTTSPENAARFQSAFGDIDVRHRLAHVNVPTLVIHSNGDTRIPIKSGRDIAASIPNAEFVSVESDNHLLIGNEPASTEFVEAVREFIDRT
ncbi:alpha/beta fold hydrolase [Ningiella sp. W23]|uniref:alpha/beta fold hydrolase n=1 Tax=Ningiella sp. W23 TaxID=3023715 RepID=UPI0037566952